MDALQGMNVDVRVIVRFLAVYGYLGPRWGAKGVVVGREGLVLAGDRVVTVVVRGA